jgi:hypothetical protein
MEKRALASAVHDYLARGGEIHTLPEQAVSVDWYDNTPLRQFFRAVGARGAEARRRKRGCSGTEPL